MARKQKTTSKEMSLKEFLENPSQGKKAISNPNYLFAFTGLSTQIVMTAFELRDILNKVRPELERRILATEKTPYLEHALHTMNATAIDLFNKLQTLVDGDKGWIPQLRSTTNRFIVFGSTTYGTCYVDAAEGLAVGIVAAICPMMPDKVLTVESISTCFPEMPPENRYHELESYIFRVQKMMGMLLEDWPELETFCELSREEFLGTVERLGLFPPAEKSWFDVITYRPPSPKNIPKQGEAAAIFRNVDNGWHIEFEGKAILVPKCEGARVVRMLLQNKNKEVSWLILFGIGSRGIEKPETDGTTEISKTDYGWEQYHDKEKAFKEKKKAIYASQQMDEITKKAVEDEILDLESRIKEGVGTIEQRDEWREKIDTLKVYLRQNIDVTTGKIRHGASDVKKARDAVKRALRTFLAKLKNHPLKKHLENSIKYPPQQKWRQMPNRAETGPSYHPDNDIEWTTL